MRAGYLKRLDLWEMHLLRNIVGSHFFSKAPSEFGANLTKVKVLSSVKHATELFINMKRGTVANKENNFSEIAM